MKPDCYKCKHRGTLRGSAHSRCLHPQNGPVVDNPLGVLFSTLASVGRVAPVTAETAVKVKGHPHGIARGWFNWPWQFDPCWLQECSGWEPAQVTAKPG